nr:hypothetical protein [Streptomyces sp. 3213.3]
MINGTDGIGHPGRGRAAAGMGTHPVVVGAVAVVPGVSEDRFTRGSDPADVVHVQVGEHDIGDLLGRDAKIGERVEQLSARFDDIDVRSQSRVDQDRPVSRTQQENPETLWFHGAVGAGRAAVPQWTVPPRTTFWKATGLKGHTPARATGG